MALAFVLNAVILIERRKSMEYQMDKKALRGQVTQVISIAESLFHNQILGIYLYGSATMGGLRPDSDIDILIIITQDMSSHIRDNLTKQLLTVSGSVGCVEKRPLEVTVISHNNIVPWNFPPKCEYMYGEWLREEMEAGKSPQPCYDPDIAILLWQARKTSVTLRGIKSTKLLPSISFHEIKQAIQSSLSALISSFEGDERNVLLTLSRMWYTLETEEIASKDIAAEWVLPQLPETLSAPLKIAKEAYLGNLSDEWKNTNKNTLALIEFIKCRIEGYYTV